MFVSTIEDMKDNIKELLELVPEEDKTQFLIRLSEFIGKQFTKNWEHTRALKIIGKYHKCACCNQPIGEIVYHVIKIEPSGDKQFVFCSQQCLENYEGFV